MRIHYKITGEDVVVFNLQHLNSISYLKKKQLRGRVILSSLYALIAIALFIYEPGYWPFSWLLMFFAILWFIFYPKVWENRVRKKILKIFKKRHYGTSELDFRPDQIFVKQGENEAYIPWSSIKKLVHTDQHIFIYLTEDNGIIISKAGLQEGPSWDELCAYLNKNIR